MSAAAGGDELLFHPIHYVSLLVCILLIVGVRYRTRRRVHIPLMLSAILIDVGMVLYIELSRGAIKSAQAKMGPLMMVHIAISVSVLVLYAIQVYSGIRKFRGGTSALHRRVMWPTLVLRIGNFVTSIMVMGL